MRKFLLSAVALLLGVGGMTAAISDKLTVNPAVSIKMEKPMVRKAAKADAASRWDCSFIIGNDVTAGNFQDPGTYRVAVVIPEYVAKQCVGSKLTDIFFLMGPSVKTDGKVFITKGVGGESLWEKDITLKLGTLSGNNLTPGENEIILDDPYVFTGEEIAVGYEFIAPRSTQMRSYYPLCYGYEEPINSCADNVGMTTAQGEVWDHLGLPLTIMLGVEGENLPTWAGVVDYMISPVVKPGDNVNVTLQVANIGANPVSSVGGFTTVDDVDGQEQTIPVNINAGRTGVADFSVTGMDKEGLYMVGATMNKVNDANYCEPVEVEDFVKNIANGVKRRVVVEEWTGSWCGYCPRGIWGMDYMKENYPDDFIGIAVHYDDEMEATSYINSLAALRVVSGFPGSLADRMMVVEPSPDNFAELVETFGGNKGFADITIDAKYVDEAEKTLEITGDVKVTYDVAEVNALLANSKYRVSFVIIENKVPGKQSNYYAGGRLGACGGWESLPSSVEWDYDDVARTIDTFDGIAGLLPDVMEKDKEYSFTHKMTLPKSVKVGSNIDIIAMLINTTTGYIENAVKIAGPQRAASIDQVLGDSNSAVSVNAGAGVITIAGECAAAEVYGFNGVRVASVAGAQTVAVAPGLYIVKTEAVDGTVSTVKVVVR